MNPQLTQPPEYVDQQDFVEKLNNKALVYNDDFIGIASYNIFVGIYVATIFGSGYFFDLFWPERYESPSVRFAWKVCSVLAIIFCLGAALGLTVCPSPSPPPPNPPQTPPPPYHQNNNILS